MTHICVSKLTIIGSDNGLSSSRCQAIIWTNAGILLKRTSGTNFSEILSEMHAFSLKKMHLKMSSTKWRPFCLGLNGLKKLKTNEWPIWVLFSRCSRALWTNESINYIFVKYINAVWQYQIPPKIQENAGGCRRMTVHHLFLPFNVFEIWPWPKNYIHHFLWDVVIIICGNFSQPPLKLGRCD